MNNLDSMLEIPLPPRQEVVSPSQSAFGLRPYEDEGEDGEGEAASEVEEDNFDDEGEDGDDDDWDAVSVFRNGNGASVLFGLIDRWSAALCRLLFSVTQLWVT